MSHSLSRQSVRTVVRRRLLPLSLESKHRRPSLRHVGLTLVVILYLAQALYFNGYVNDDAYITFRYSRMLAEGDGPYYNHGQHVEGYSSPLWMLLLSVMTFALGAPALPGAAKLLGMCAGAATVVVTFYIVRLLVQQVRGSPAGGDMPGLIVAGLVAVNPSFAVNMVSGLETGLFGSLVIAAVYAVISEWMHARWRGAGVLLALLTLCRPEGMVIAVLLWGVQWWQSHTGLKWVGQVAADDSIVNERLVDYSRLVYRNGWMLLAIISIQIGVRFIVYDGELLPNTYWAKRADWFSLDAWQYIAAGVSDNILLPIGLLAAATTAALMRKHLKLIAPVLAVAICLVAPLFTGSDWMPGYRFLVPYFPVVFILAGVGVAAVFAARNVRRVAPLAAVLLGVIPMAWFMQSESRAELHGMIETRASGYSLGHMALVDWLKSSPGGVRSISLMDIGIVGFECPDLDVIDLTGLTDRTIAHSEGGFLSKQYPPSYLLNQRPDVVVLVFTAPGDPAAPPPEDATFRLWTPMEQRLYFNPNFRRHYFRRTYTASPSHDWRDRIARQLGADRIFVHDYPEHYYLLAVFRRQE